MPTRFLFFRTMPVVRCVVCISLLFLISAHAPRPGLSFDVDPALPDGTADATRQMATFRLPAGLKVELFAAEPQLGNPVAICLDEQGRVYVAEQYRFNRGTEENRTRPFLLEDDLQLQTVDDRLAMFKKWADRFEGGLEWFSRWSDQVRRVEDTNGDGRADTATIFANGFNGPLDGLAAGVLARDGNVYFTCIPNLWLLRDENGDGKADVRKVLQTGFGVNAAFLGHDLHGMVWGPDGKLYFSVGDRGFHVTGSGVKQLDASPAAGISGATRPGELHGPRTGAVFRCRADGTELELIHRGLRNPQELAFDQYGNLFAADNNCDKGDHSRLVFVVEGGESGWNMAYQTIPAPYLTGPWHAERLWHLYHKDQPAWIVPPVGKLGAGPSGFTYYPGVGLPERYREHFFMCNYTGNGGVEAFALKPAGAGFEIIDDHDFLKPIQATDVDFGYDGKMYVSDYVRLEWNGGSAGGRIYTVSDPALVASPLVAEVQALFKAGFASRPDAELEALLEHADMRVRQRAQFALAERDSGLAHFERVLRSSAPVTARLHALWGIGQMGEKRPQALRSLEVALRDPHEHLRAQAARLLGEHRDAQAPGLLIPMLADESLVVRFHAAMSLGRLPAPQSVAPVVEMLRENDDRDPFLRHAGVMALARNAVADLSAMAKDASAAVRRAVLLVQRRRNDPQIALFLNDADLTLVSEAARAIHDLQTETNLPQLADLAARFGASPVPPDLDPLLRRIVSACYRLGDERRAAAVARIAINSHFTTAVRGEAVGALSAWDHPPQRDRVTGIWRPLEKRQTPAVKGVVQPMVTEFLSSLPDELQQAGTELVSRLDIEADASTFLAWVQDIGRSPGTRVAALKLLAARKSTGLQEALQSALEDGAPALRAAARDLLVSIDPGRALSALKNVLQDEQADVLEQQLAFSTLATMKSPDADAVLELWTAELAAGRLRPSLQLEIVEAATARKTPAMNSALQKFTSMRRDGDPLAPYRVALAGGNVGRGRQLFSGHAQAQCVRCHKIGEAGGVAGPDLSKVAMRHDREALLLSLIDPNAKISPGFGSLALVLNNGRVVNGTLKAEENGKLTLQLADGQVLTIPASEVDERSASKSAMPGMARVLSVREMRDLVEFLASLK